MSLAKRLDAIRAASAEKFAPAVVKVMHGAVAELRGSGIVHSMLTVGAQAPDFTLPTSDRGTIALQSELDKGPLILTFFRGSW
ncbi:MAG: hypothetical protein AAF581_16460 [Planctomycetota bacterium]